MAAISHSQPVLSCVRSRACSEGLRYAGGKVTIRHLGRLRHLYISYKHKREPVTLLVAGASVRVVAEDGSILRELTLDAERGYQQVGQQARSTMS